MASKDNVLKFMELAGIKKSDFYRKTGLSNGFLDKNANISSDKIKIIISAYPEIDVYWLITGEGKMLKSATDDCTINTEIIYKSDPHDAELISSKNEIIETQKKLILSLEQRIKELEHCTSYSKDSAFPSAHSAASIGGVHQSKTTK